MLPRRVLLFKSVNALKDKIERLESTLSRTSVSSTLDSVRQLAGRTTSLVDPYALIAALEQLADVSRETVHPDRKGYDAIFKQCRPLVDEPRLAAIVINLLGDKEEKLVAGQIHKLLKSSNPSPSPRGPVLQFGHGSQPGPSFVGPICSPLASEAVEAGAQVPYAANASIVRVQGTYNCQLSFKQEETIKVYCLCISPFGFVSLSVSVLFCFPLMS